MWDALSQVAIFPSLLCLQRLLLCFLSTLSICEEVLQCNAGVWDQRFLRLLSRLFCRPFWHTHLLARYSGLSAKIHILALFHSPQSSRDDYLILLCLVPTELSFILYRFFDTMRQRPSSNFCLVLLFSVCVLGSSRHRVQALQEILKMEPQEKFLRFYCCSES